MKLLTWQLERSGITHRELGEKAGWPTHTALYRWLRLEGEPKPQEVFQIEKVFAVPPGTLSRTLGYLPLEARRQIDVTEGFESFVANDPNLDELGRRILLKIYSEVAGRGRKLKGGRAASN